MPGFAETPVGSALLQRHEASDAELPDDVADLWEALRSMKQKQLLQLLAYCAATTIDCVVVKGSDKSASSKHAQKLAEAVSLDMAKCWQPTADSYLNHVTKPLILDAVREGVSDNAAANLSAMKKGDMAQAAEQLLAGKNWLPPMLRPQQAA